MDNGPRFIGVRIFAMLVILFLACFLVTKDWGKPKSGPQLKSGANWTTYYGSIETGLNNYRVMIDEGKKENKPYGLVVSLYPVGKPTTVRIVGHAYKAGGNWERISYCGYHMDGQSGCSSVSRTESGWKWEPNPADEGKVPRLSDDEIRTAITELDFAMRAIHNADHVTERGINKP